jgi:Na+-driven multidrug efflux pump
MSVGADPVQLSVRNTALGTVGVAITTIAAIVLGIALLFRAVRALKWRMRRRAAGPRPPVTDPLAP